MKVAYFDCFNGAAGDMIVGALLDAGLDFDALRADLATLPLSGVTVSAETVRRGGMAGTKFHVTVDQADQPARHLADILAMIDAAVLPDPAGANARAIFERLAAAEAKVHGVAIEAVHFHEVGAADSIVDIVASAVGLARLGIGKVLCSPIPTGRGTVRTAHGLLPVPAPATAELLRGAEVAEPTDADVAGELTTPTGAAVLTTLAEGYGPVPAMAVEAIGYGAGTRDAGPLPNLLRVVVGRVGDGAVDTVVELAANLDDCTGEILGAAIEALLSAGALDAWATPITMKKSRPAWTLSALCRPADAARAEEIFFAETPTLGVRRRTCGRRTLARRHVTVGTPYGRIRVKVAGPGGAGVALTASPEFADCAAAAEAHGAAVRTVIDAAMDAYRTHARLHPGDANRP